MDAYTLTLYDDAGNPIPIPAIQGVGIKEIRLKEAGETEDTYEIVLDDDRVFSFYTKHGDDYILTAEDKSEIAELVGIPDSGSYRLLKTITVPEATQQIFEKWGTGYDGKGYDGAVVVFENISGISNTDGMYMYATIGSPQTDVGIGAQLKNGQVMRLIARKLNGLWDIFGCYGAEQANSNMLGPTRCGALYSTKPHNATPEGYRFSWDQLSRARFYTFDESLPVGMTIKIFVLGGDDNA